MATQWYYEHYIGMYSKRLGRLQIGMVWNDGHVTLNNSPVVTNTEFGRITNSRDNVFSRGADAADRTPRLVAVFGLNSFLHSSADLIAASPPYRYRSTSWNCAEHSSRPSH